MSAALAYANDAWSTSEEGAPAFAYRGVQSNQARHTNTSTWSEPRWMASFVGRLAEIAALETGWDSHGAARPNPQTLNFAQLAIGQLVWTHTLEPQVVPLAHGGVQLEWHTAELDLEIEFRRPYDAYVFFEDHRHGDQWERELTTDFSCLTRPILKLSVR